MGYDANESDKWAITQEDVPLIKAFQVCKAFNCLDINVYRKNPIWWNEWCYALIRTESKAQSDKAEDR